MRAFTDALRGELIGTRIRIMSVDPGQVLTVGACLSYPVRADVLCRSLIIFGIGLTRWKRIRSTRKHSDTYLKVHRFYLTDI